MPRWVLAAAAGLIAGVATTAGTGAVAHDKLAYLSFTAPIQVPGATLQAGTYRFRLTNPLASRNVLQVLSEDGTHLVAAFHTIPEERTRARSSEPLLTLRETPAGAPPEAKTLFYPGERVGYEFVYRRGTR